MDDLVVQRPFPFLLLRRLISPRLDQSVLYGGVPLAPADIDLLVAKAEAVRPHLHQLWPGSSGKNFRRIGQVEEVELAANGKRAAIGSSDRLLPAGEAG